MNFTFTSDIDKIRIIKFLAGPRLWIPRSSYPDYLDWLDKVNFEIEHGIKRALSCYSNKELVGVAVFQRHKTIPKFLELKNLTVMPEISRRFVASFLIRNVEVEAHGQYTHIICDAKKDNIIIHEFLTRNRYKTVANMDLYGLKAGTDNIYLKELK